MDAIGKLYKVTNENSAFFGAVGACVKYLPETVDMATVDDGTETGSATAPAVLLDIQGIVRGGEVSGRFLFTLGEVETV